MGCFPKSMLKGMTLLLFETILKYQFKNIKNCKKYQDNRVIPQSCKETS